MIHPNGSYTGPINHVCYIWIKNIKKPAELLFKIVYTTFPAQQYHILTLKLQLRMLFHNLTRKIFEADSC